MSSALKKIDDRARQSLRLDQVILDAMDAARAKRPGFVSRNTWIVEAIEEKLAREQKERGKSDDRGKIHLL